MGQASRLRFARGSSGADQWRFVFAEPAAPLRGHVLRYCGYVETTATPMKRRELPFGGIPMIINLGPTLRVAQASDRISWVRQGTGFIAGLHDRFTLTETSGAQRGMQIDFSPIGASLFLDRPLRALNNAVIDLETLLGPEAPFLIEALDAAPGWEERSRCSTKRSRSGCWRRRRSIANSPISGASSKPAPARSRSARWPKMSAGRASI
ncbi:MAG: DUF6597 domain-containing transcriptional factor [Aliidongia sp.]